MKEIICYQAKDGKIFSNRKLCLLYEKYGNELILIKKEIIEYEEKYKNFKTKLNDNLSIPIDKRKSYTINWLQSQIHKIGNKIAKLYKQEFDLKYKNSMKSRKVKGS